MKALMNRFTLKKQTVYIVLGLAVAMQPILDILTYFIYDSQLSVVSTVLRFGFFIGFSIFGFIISKQKKRYVILGLLLALFFAIHAFFNYQQGYTSLLTDIMMYLRVIQVFIYLLVFDDVRLFLTGKEDKQTISKEVNKLMLSLLLLNLMIISLSIVLSYALNMPSYTYFSREGPLGVKGWFLTGNSQSIIVVVLSVFSLAYALNYKKFLFSLFVVVLTTLNLFTFGTKVTFYSIYILSAGFIVLLLFSKAHLLKQKLPLIGLLTSVLLVVTLLVEHSPMALNTNLQSVSFNEWQEKIDKLGEDPTQKPPKEYVPGNFDVSKGPLFNKTYYTKVYTLYSKPLVDEFGIIEVAKKFNFSLDAGVLMNNRLNKTIGSSLVFESQSFGVQLFGFEQADYTIGNVLYDVENDFSGMLFSYGYVGLSLYSLFIGYFLIRGALSYFFASKHRFNLVLGASLVSLLLILGAAQFSGNVFKQVNVVFYVALTLFLIYSNSLSLKELAGGLKGERP